MPCCKEQGHIDILKFYDIFLPNLNLSVNLCSNHDGYTNTSPSLAATQYSFIQYFAGAAMRRRTSTRRLTTWHTTPWSAPSPTRPPPWRTRAASPSPSSATSSTTWWSPRARTSPKLSTSTKQTCKNKKTLTHSMPSAQCIGHKKSTCKSFIFLESHISSKTKSKGYFENNIKVKYKCFFLVEATVVYQSYISHELLGKWTEFYLRSR